MLTAAGITVSRQVYLLLVILGERVRPPDVVPPINAIKTDDINLSAMVIRTYRHLASPLTTGIGHGALPDARPQICSAPRAYNNCPVLRHAGFTPRFIVLTSDPLKYDTPTDRD